MIDFGELVRADGTVGAAELYRHLELAADEWDELAKQAHEDGKPELALRLFCKRCVLEDAAAQIYGKL